MKLGFIRILRGFDTFKAKSIFLRITSCIHRSLHPEDESTILCGGYQSNLGDVSHYNKSLITIEIVNIFPSNFP